MNTKAMRSVLIEPIIFNEEFCELRFLLGNMGLPLSEEESNACYSLCSFGVNFIGIEDETAD